MPTLIVLQGPDKGRTFATSEDLVLMGRESEQVPLRDNTVSRRHAELRRHNGVWELADLGSSNGTYLNGQRIRKPAVLKHGDQIRIGTTLIVYGGHDPRESRTPQLTVRDAVDLDAGRGLEASILASVDSSDDSVIIAAPETADAARAWKAVERIVETMATLTSPDVLLERVMDVLFEEMPIDRGFILMRGGADGEPVPRVVRYRGKVKQQRISTSRTIIDHVLEHRQGVLCTNAQTDRRFAGADARTSSIHRYGLRSVICAPIVAADEVLGVIHVDSSVSAHTYTDAQLRLVVSVGTMAGLAIENARLMQSRVQSERLAATGQTVASLSHYIRNILQGLQSGSEMVDSGLGRQNLGRVDQGWQIVQRNLDRIYQLTSNMLAFSKSREPRLDHLQPNHVVREAVDLAQRRADEKAVVLLTELDEHAPAIPADADGLHQVVLNLVSNAVEAVEPRAGAVNVKTAFDADAGELVLTVADNGPGIPDADQPRVFEAFYSSKGQGGTGLGLAVARKIVQEHHGGITLKSLPGQGTIFEVRLPAARRVEASAETQSPPAAAAENP